MFAGGGSPPLARGTDLGNIFAVARKGITPACAGNSQLFVREQLTGVDHPRLRGEQWGISWAGVREMGSPPLARGTGQSLATFRQPFRITPACAGNRSPPLVPSSFIRDHPRLRGEQQSAPAFLQQNMGSPPLARGTELRCTHSVLAIGITPACAGNRIRRSDSK